MLFSLVVMLPVESEPVELSTLSSCTEILEWSSSAMVGKELSCAGLVRSS
jgi:hypothetical protein